MLKNRDGSTDASAFEVTTSGSFICFTYNPPAKTDMAESMNRYVNHEYLVCLVRHAFLE